MSLVYAKKKKEKKRVVSGETANVAAEVAVSHPKPVLWYQVWDLNQLEAAVYWVIDLMANQTTSCFEWQCFDGGGQRKFSSSCVYSLFFFFFEEYGFYFVLLFSPLV